MKSNQKKIIEKTADFIKENSNDPGLFVPLDFDGEKIKIVSLSTMEKIYRSAGAREQGKDKKKVKQKWQDSRSI